MNPYKIVPLAIAAAVLLSSTTSRAESRSDALDAVRDASAAIDDDRRECRTVAARDVEDATRKLRRAKKAKDVRKISEWLADLTRDARRECESATIRSLRRATRETARYAEALRKATTKQPPTGMAASQFRRLQAAVRKQSFNDGKIAVIVAALAHNPASVAQLVILTKMISFDDDRLTLVGKVYRAIVDRKANGYRIASAFSFSEDGKKAVRILTQ